MQSDDAQERSARLEQAVRLKRAMARSRDLELPRRPVGEAPRLSEVQRSVWLAHQLDKTSPTYNLVSAYRFSGELDDTLLERSLDTLVAHHRILRSTFRADAQGVLQQINDDAVSRLEVIDAGEHTVEEAATREAQKPFDLEVGPLLRLLRVEGQRESEQLLVLVMHHVLADERSLDIFWRQFAEAYGGELSLGESAQLDDYNHWLASQGPQAWQRELDYWTTRLDRAPDDLALPVETSAGQSRPLGQRGQLLRRTVGRESTGDDVLSAVREVAAALGTTPFVVFAFVFRLLLERYEQRGVAFAVPATTRSHPDTAEMIGYFLNPLLVVTSLDEHQSLESSMTAFAEELKEVLAHAQVPFSVLTEHLAFPHRKERHPLFQTMFVYREEPKELVSGRAAATPGRARSGGIEVRADTLRFDS